VTRVYAEGARCAHPQHEDILACVLRFGDAGPFGLLDVSWLSHEARRTLSITGERGVLDLDYIAQEVRLTDAITAVRAPVRVAAKDPTRTRASVSPADPLQAELEAFATCILEDTPEPVPAADGCRALAGALAIRSSAATSQPVQVVSVLRDRSFREAA